MRELTSQQQIFCKLYALYGGTKGAGTKSAKEAGYKPKGAASLAYHLLKRPEILERIEIEKKALADKVEMTTIDIIKRYQDMAKMTGEYKEATITESERALKQLGKYKSIQGFVDKLVIEHKAPFQDWTIEERDKFIDTGDVPKGKKLPDLESISEIVSRGISEKSGESIN